MALGYFWMFYAIFFPQKRWFWWILKCHTIFDCVHGKICDTKILIDTDDKFIDYITLKNVVMLITYGIKDDAKFYQQIFLEEALYNE